MSTAVSGPKPRIGPHTGVSQVSEIREQMSSIMRPHLIGQQIRIEYVGPVAHFLKQSEHAIGIDRIQDVLLGRREIVGVLLSVRDSLCVEILAAEPPLVYPHRHASNDISGPAGLNIPMAIPFVGYGSAVISVWDNSGNVVFHNPYIKPELFGIHSDEPAVEIRIAMFGREVVEAQELELQECLKRYRRHRD